VERLGYSEARRLAVTGGKLDASKALGVRLVHAVHATSDLDAALDAELSQIRKGAPNAIAATKALMRRARLEAPASLVQDAAEAFAKAARSDEGAEGMTAFLEKRPARWAQEG
jgi:isohexenylglutaconyl-CoA hydratase